ncbi:Structural maintenance of chromosomes protein 3 [Tulasnella sp. UAMH 9824]|nr:Structural maintenance of chromosomes protein 3 [Tulasnella sp. UAMH 9824]
MTREERQALLHEGVSVATTLSAYVEIVFDNSDSRFPTGKDEVVLRRTIGLKKDEYSLDKKSVQKADVMNLLESAGFSKSNPYYIVPQGRITSLTNAKDYERLALLKEVAGTKVYEQRRAESLRVMDETKAKQAKIREVLDYIQERLEELETEKEELKEFQEKDKERRCLEYSLYQAELTEITQALEEIEDERKQEVINAEQRRKEFGQREKQIEKLENDIKAARQQLTVSALTKQGIDDEMSDLVRSQTEIQCIIEDLQAAEERGQERREELQTELEGIERRITGLEAELMEVLPDYQDKAREEKEEKRRLDEAQARLGALSAKQGRVTLYKTKADRDKYLKSEINSLDSYERTQQQTLDDARAELGSAQRRLEELDQKAEEVGQNLEDRRERLRQMGEQAAQTKEEHSKLTEQRKELWREDAKLESAVAHSREELRNAERSLAGMMDKDTGSGLRALDNIVDRLGLQDKVYGPLYKLFEIPDRKYNTAVEVTAGNSLFHVVVDTDATATQIVNAMNREKTGRLTFIPLNRIHPKPAVFPEAGDAIPLIQKIQYDPKLDKAFQQVFGKTCLCEDLTVAAAYVRSHNLNTITVLGDKVDRKGSLTGGYHSTKSRLEMVKNVRNWSTKLEEETRNLREVKTTILTIDQKITRLVGELQVLNAKRTQAQSSRDPLANEATFIHREREQLAERIEKLESDVADLEADISAYAAKKASLKQELASPMVKTLSDAEIDEMEELGKEVENRKKTLLEVSRRKNELASRKANLDIELNESLRRRREELRGKIESLGEATGSDAAEGSDDLATRKRELASLNDTIATLEAQLENIESETEKQESALRKARDQLEKVQAQQAEDSRGIARQQKNADRYLTKRQMLLGKKDEASKNIRDLGVLPEEAFEKYTGVKPDRLVKKLHNVNEALKKFAHVNKKAFEQYSNFTKQRDQLLKRQEDLDKSEESITELVEVLDQRKDEAIERTFKQVSKNFEEVFEKLVPAGRGRLVMVKRVDVEDLQNGDDEDEDDEDAQRRRSSIDNYTGVSIKVSFNSKVDEGLRIQQLSGGQKSLVALATVFAIQKCDPAPFYLFDEIDANLDAQYRTAVASMIHELSTSAQFITTTFRPEMLQRADKFYGVLFNNQKVSSIASITRDEATQFIEQEAQATVVMSNISSHATATAIIIPRPAASRPFQGDGRSALEAAAFPELAGLETGAALVVAAGVTEAVPLVVVMLGLATPLLGLTNTVVIVTGLVTLVELRDLVK